MNKFPCSTIPRDGNPAVAFCAPPGGHGPDEKILLALCKECLRQHKFMAFHKGWRITRKEFQTLSTIAGVLET